MHYSKHPASPSETECVHWHLMKHSMYLIINIFSSIYEFFSTLYNMCKFTSQNGKKEDAAEGHRGHDTFPLPFLPTSLRIFVMTVWFHHSILPCGSQWGELRMLLLKRKHKKKRQKVITEINHWTKIAVWISFACAGLAKRSLLQLLRLHLLWCSTVPCPAGKCH